MATKEIIMSTKGLNKSFGATHAVVNLNINIQKGDIMGLVGENGAGKSTLIKILGGEHTVDSGQIIFQNNKISWHSSSEALKKGIAIVHQHPLLVSSLGAAENIFLGKEFSQGFFVDNTKAFEETKKLVQQYPIYKDKGRIGLRANLPFRLIEMEREDITDNLDDAIDEAVLTRMTTVKTGNASDGSVQRAVKAVNFYLLKNLYQDAAHNPALSSENGNITKAATRVGMQRSNFSALMKKHNLSAGASR